MNKESHRNEWKALIGFLILIVGFLISLSFISAAPFLEANKTVSPSAICVGENATITLSVSGNGSAYVARKPLDVILVIDTSCSMAYGGLDSEKIRAREVLGQLNSSIDRVGVISFNNDAFLEVGLTKNYKAVTGVIESLSCSVDNTNIGSALLLASSTLGSTQNRDNVIVLFSDGVANSPGTVSNAENYARAQAISAGNSGNIIYTIGFVGVNMGFPTNLNSVLLGNISIAGNNGRYLDGSRNIPLDVFNTINTQIVNVSGTDIIITDVLAPGVSLINGSLQSECSSSGNRVICNAGRLNIGENKSFSFRVTVNNPSLIHLNEIAYVNYTNYSGNNASIVLPNPNVTILTNCSIICGCVGNVAPNINIVLPVMGGFYNNPLNVLINATDANGNLDKVWYNIDGGENKSNGTLPGNLVGGQHTLYAYANDSCGAINFTTVTFCSSGCGGNSIGPNVTIHSPENETYYTHSILFNVTAVDDVAIDEVWCILDGELYNDCDSVFTLNLPNGNYTLYAYANDTAGNRANTSVSFIVDVTDIGCDDSCEDCKSHTRAPVNDFEDNGVVDSISMDEEVISLSLNNTAQVNGGLDLKSYTSGENNRLIFNMILLIAIVVLLLLIVLIAKR